MAANQFAANVCNNGNNQSVYEVFIITNMISETNYNGTTDIDLVRLWYGARDETT